MLSIQNLWFVVQEAIKLSLIRIAVANLKRLARLMFVFEKQNAFWVRLTVVCFIFEQQTLLLLWTARRESRRRCANETSAGETWATFIATRTSSSRNCWWINCQIMSWANKILFVSTLSNETLCDFTDFLPFVTFKMNRWHRQWSQLTEHNRMASGKSVTIASNGSEHTSFCNQTVGGDWIMRKRCDACFRHFWLCTQTDIRATTCN